MEAIHRLRLRLARSSTDPVFLREFRVRMRGARGALLLLAYPGVVACIALLIIGISMANSPAVTAEAMGEWSRRTLLGILITQCCLIVAAVPGMLGGAIAFEREAQTLEQVAITPLSARDIVLGKYAAAMVQVGYLILATVPVAGICFLMGGVSWGVVAPGVTVCVCGALGTGAMAICCSTVFRSSVSGIILAYVLAMGFNLLLPFGELMIRQLATGTGSDPLSFPFVSWLSLFGLLDAGMSGTGYWLGADLWWMCASVCNLTFAIAFLMLATMRLRSLLRV